MPRRKVRTVISIHWLIPGSAVPLRERSLSRDHLKRSGLEELVGQFAVRIAVCLLALVAFTGHPVAEAQETDANALLVEAGRLIIDAGNRAMKPEDRIDRLELAKAKLEQIIDEHPTSDAAVKLVTGQGVGTISLAAVDRMLASATQACWGSTSVKCISRLATEVALLDDVAALLCHSRVELLTEVGKAHESLGDFNSAQRSLDLAESNGLSCEDDYYDEEQRAWVLYEIAKERVAAGQFYEAMRMATSVLEEKDKVRIALELASTDLDSHQFEEVLNLASSLGISDDVVLYRFADRRIDHGAFDLAREAAALIENPSTRGNALINAVFAEAEATEGAEPDVATIREAMQLLDDDTERLHVAVRLALAQAKTSADPQGLFAEAVAAAQQIDDGHARSESLVNVALAQGSAGIVQDAVVTLEAAEDAIPALHYGELQLDLYWRVRSLVYVARTHAELGDSEAVAEATAEALHHIDAVDAIGYRYSLVYHAASANVEAHRLHDAHEIAGKLPENHRYKAGLYAEIGGAYDAAGDKQLARDSFASAVRFAQGADDPYQRLGAYWFILAEQASSRYLNSRKVTASIEAAGEELDDEGKQAFAQSLALLANARITGRARGAARELQGIIQTASETDDEELGILLRRVVCEVHSTLGQFSAALMTARSIEDAAWRMRTIGRVARLQAEAGLADEAKETAGLIQKDREYSRLGPDDLARVASQQLAAGSVFHATATLLTASQRMTTGSYYPAGWGAIASVYADAVDEGEILSQDDLGIELLHAWESAEQGDRETDDRKSVATLEHSYLVVRADGEEVIDASGLSVHSGRGAGDDRMVFGLVRDGDRREVEAVIRNVRDARISNARAALQRALDRLPFGDAQNRSSSLVRIAAAYAELGHVEDAELAFERALAAAMPAGEFDERMSAVSAVASAQEEAQVDSTVTIDRLQDMLSAMYWIADLRLEGEQAINWGLVTRLARKVVARRLNVFESLVAFMRKTDRHSEDIDDDLGSVLEGVHEITDELFTAATRISDTDVRFTSLARIARRQERSGARASGISILSRINIDETESIWTLSEVAKAWAAVDQLAQAKTALRRALALAENNPWMSDFELILRAALAIELAQRDRGR